MQMLDTTLSSEIIKNFNTYLNKKKSRTDSQLHNNYLIKINEDNKLIIDVNLHEKKLKTLLSLYYADYELEIFPIDVTNTKIINLMKTLIETNSFFKNNDVEPTEFIYNIKKLEALTNYFDKLNINNVLTYDILRNKVVLDNNFYCPIINQPSNINKNIEIKQGFSACGDYNDLRDNCTVKAVENNDFMKIDEFEEPILENANKYNIYFNTQFNNLFIVEYDKDLIGNNNELKQIFPELTLILSNKLYEVEFKKLKEIQTNIYVNIDDAKSAINKIIDDKVVDSKLTIDEIKTLINKYFAIDNNPANKIKFTNIWEIISSKIKVSESYINYIKRQLPVILTDLGLKKKRFTDGMYWYGLTKKTIIEKANTELLQPSQKILQKMSETEFNEQMNFLKNNREKDLNDINTLFKLTDENITNQNGSQQNSSQNEFGEFMKDFMNKNIIKNVSKICTETETESESESSEKIVLEEPMTKLLKKRSILKNKK
jgi:hypothetical protein